MKVHITPYGCGYHITGIVPWKGQCSFYGLTMKVHIIPGSIPTRSNPIMSNGHNVDGCGRHVTDTIPWKKLILE